MCHLRKLTVLLLVLVLLCNNILTTRAQNPVFKLALVSDTTTEYLTENGNWSPAVFAWVSPDWPSLFESSWIWKSEMVTPEEALNGTSITTFRRRFNLPLDARNVRGSLQITADNAYEILLNGTVIGADGVLDPGSIDLSWTSIETYPFNAQPGVNEILIRAINYRDSFDRNDPQLNPAGVVFSAEITYDKGPTCPPETKILLKPSSVILPVGASHDLIVTVQDNQGNRVTACDVTFSIIAGPNAGLSNIVRTNAIGTAVFTYMSSVAGEDTVVATITDNIGNQANSSPASVSFVLAAAEKPTKEQKEKAAKAAQELYEQAAVEAAVGVGCAFAPEPFTKVCAVGAGFLSAITALMATRLDRIAKDPADPNFTSIALPVVPSLPQQPIVAGEGITQQVADALNALFTNQEQAIGLMSAILTSLERAQGAHEVGDTFWEVRQLKVAQQYMTQLVTLLSASTELNANLQRVLQDIGFQRSFTASDLLLFQSNIVRNGLPPWMTQSLIDLNTDAATIDEIYRNILMIDVNKAATDGDGNFPQLLTDPSLIASILDVSDAFYNFNLLGSITIIKDAQPNSSQDFAYYGPFGKFFLDDVMPDDGDAIPISKTYTVDPGTYNFAESVLQSWYLADIQCVGTGQSTNDMARHSVRIVVALGDVMTCAFVSQRRVNLQAIKFNDLNSDSVRQVNEPLLSPWEFRFYKSDGLLINHKVTDANGSAVQSNLIPGSYKICETPKVGWTNTLPGQIDPLLGFPCYSLTLEPGQNASLLFGNTEGTVTHAGEEFNPLSGIVISKLPDINESESEEPVENDSGQQIYLPMVSR